MEFEQILPIALKVLGCAVVLYIIAGFAVGCAKALPFLAILAGVGTFFATEYMLNSGDPETIWLPIVASILMQIFYKGTDYMNPRIDQNVYQLISVERKWNSIFADSDDYELYFAPVAIGGFIENTIFTAIFFGAFYYFIPIYFPNTWLVHAVTFYVVGMSLIDVLGVISVLDIGMVFYGLLRIFVIIGAVTLGFLGPFNDDSYAQQRKNVYEQCSEVVAIDYSQSYYMYYEYASKSSSGYQTYEEKYFVYDAQLGVGADYDARTWGKLYDVVYTTDSHFGDKVCQFNNYGDINVDFRYIREAEEVGGPFKYTTQEGIGFGDYWQFTEHKFEHLGSDYKRYSDRQLINVVYNTTYDSTYDHENDIHYVVDWWFNTDKDGNVVSLNSITCEYYHNNNHNRETWSYSRTSNTGLDELFDEDGKLKGYTYKENEQFGVDMPSEFNLLNGQQGAVGDYDFKLHITSGEDSIYYIHDKDSNLTVGYVNNDMKVTHAINYSNYDYYRPDWFVNNTEKTMHDSQCNLVGENNGSRFKKFTYDNAIVSKAIMQAFAGYYSPSEIEYIDWGYGDFSVKIVNRNVDLDTNVEYTFSLGKDGFNRYYVYAVTAKFTYEDCEYTLYVPKVHNPYTISMPTT